MILPALIQAGAIGLGLLFQSKSQKKRDTKAATYSRDAEVAEFENMFKGVKSDLDKHYVAAGLVPTYGSKLANIRSQYIRNINLKYSNII